MARKRRYKFKPGDRVILSPGTYGACVGTILELADGLDGDWEVDSDEHGYVVARYEWEMILLENANADD